ncbi:hypothetical protein BGZ94_000521 [Podila epigama]|nr:hypothetical protein BGZ94_000521 [Podila epigama]
MDELQYSVRSVAENVGGGVGNKIHILTADVGPVSGVHDEASFQVPFWLDLGASKDTVHLVPHSSIFEDSSVLPSFNSLSIESQLHHIPNITDIFMYLNDDVFLGTRTLPSDIWTPIYGFVFHLEPTLLVPPTPLPAPRNTATVGEWHSLRHSNVLLSTLFGPRPRAYLAHVPHVLSTPMLEEIQTLWPNEFRETSAHRFRGDGDAQDVQVSFLMAHYVIERLRETMLSSFWKYRLDVNQDGKLDWSEREALIRKVDAWNRAQETRTGTMRGEEGGQSTFASFLETHYLQLGKAGFNLSGSSYYQLSGLDGYPFMLMPTSNNSSSTTIPGSPSMPSPSSKAYLASDSTADRTCQFNVHTCLGDVFLDQTVTELDAVTSQTIFQHLAFDASHCGDCLLHILRQSSTEPGLGSDIMPLDTSSVAFKTVAADLEKYNYVVATSSYSFIQLYKPEIAERDLARIMDHRWYEAFFCINDNVPGGDPTVEKQVRDVFKRFLDIQFPTPSPWEKKKGV